MIKLPKQLKDINLENIKIAPIGFSGDQVYIVDGGYKGKDIVIKMSKRIEVYHEGENLKWLKKYVAAPDVYFNKKIEGTYYLVMEKLPGVMFQELLTEIPIKDFIIKYAKLIKQFHSINYEGLPYNHDLKSKLKQVYQTVNKSEVKEQYFEREIKHLDGKQVYQLMMENMVDSEDLVLCHGDVCMPNIIMENNNLSGFIDIIGVGVCDRYLDIAIALRTLRYNLELYGYSLECEYIKLFKDSYGIDKLDCEKIKFYFLLDELTNG